MMNGDIVHVVNNDDGSQIEATSTTTDMEISNYLPLFRLLRIRPREWMQVYCRIRSHPHEVMPSSPAKVSPIVRRISGIGEDGPSFPLHDAISLQAPLFVIEKLIEAFPPALDMQDEWGRTPLEIAMGIDGYVSNEESLFSSSQDARDSSEAFRSMRNIAMLDPSSYTSSSASGARDELEVLQYLAKRTMIYRKEIYGVSKAMEFEYTSWKSYCNPRLAGQLDNRPEEERAARFNANLTPVFTQNDVDLNFVDGELRRFYQKWMIELKAVISVVWPHLQDESSCSQRILHFCASSNCPELLLMLAMMSFPEQMTIANDEGNFPIHLACSNRAMYGRLAKVYYNDGYTTRLNWEISNEALKRLVSFYPNGSQQPNRDGLPALHLALKNGKTWQSGVREILSVSKQCIAFRDRKTGLYPFMLAAVEGSQSRIEKNWKFAITDAVSEHNAHFTFGDVEKFPFKYFCDQLHREALSTVYELLRFKADLMMIH